MRKPRCEPETQSACLRGGRATLIFPALCALLLSISCRAAMPPRITAFTASGVLAWTNAHLLVNGIGGNFFARAGDGRFFYAPDQALIGEGRSVTMDYAGNIIICESDYGFIRRIRFLRLQP